jgi:hypothetical protein
VIRIKEVHVSALIESARGIIAGVADAASGAAREIDRRRRIIGIESEMNDARRAIARQHEEMGRHMMTLFNASVPAVPAEVAAMCRQIISLEEQIKLKEQEVRDIAQEGAAQAGAAQPVQGAVGADAFAAPATPVSSIQTPTVAQPTPPASPLVNGASVQPAPLANCPSCGAALTKPGAKFCTACGQKIA